MDMLQAKSPFFDKDMSYILRGFSMVAIIIHHICNQCGKFYPDLHAYLHLEYTSSWGYLGTGVFFLISGYGMFMSLMKNHPISSTYILKHLWGLMKPFLIVFAIDAFISVILNGVSTTLLADLLTLKIASKDTWFIKVILFAYLFSFTLFFVKARNITRCISLLCISLVYVICAIYILQLPSKWYITILNFPLGMFVALYFTDITSFLYKKKNNLIVCIISSLLFIFFRYGINIPILNSLLFSLCTVLFIRFFKIKLKIVKYIGINSIYFYLGHYVICYRLFEQIHNIPLLILLTFLTPTLLSIAFGKSYKSV